MSPKSKMAMLSLNDQVTGAILAAERVPKTKTEAAEKAWWKVHELEEALVSELQTQLEIALQGASLAAAKSGRLPMAERILRQRRDFMSNLTYLETLKELDAFKEEPK